MEEASPGLTLTTDAIPLYDPSNFTIVSCDQGDWDLATRIMQSGRMKRLGTFCVSFQGEVNETNEKEKCLSAAPSAGPLILRGANICLYAVRGASQGEAFYISVQRFLAGKRPGAKAFHSQEERVGFQRSSPQNNFRRIVAALISANNFCFDTISYIPHSQSSLHPLFLLGLLNSRLSDWYFRLGSTNSKVNEYQFNNLPCPQVAAERANGEAKRQKAAESALAAGRPEEALDLLRPLLAKPPFSPAVQEIIVAAVQRIMALEADRGDIARTERLGPRPGRAAVSRPNRPAVLRHGGADGRRSESAGRAVCEDAVAAGPKDLDRPLPQVVTDRREPCFRQVGPELGRAKKHTIVGSGIRP